MGSHHFWKLLVPLFVVFAGVTWYMFFTGRWQNHPNAGLKIEQIISQLGYPLEKHIVETDDGYILTLLRIPYGNTDKPQEKPRTPVLIVHGLLSSAFDYVILPEKRGLAYFLADNGYDVWLFNARGTTLSRKHKIMDPDRDKEEFWNFSWHEIGVYDIPATIDYVLSKTNHSSLHYVGVSQGSAVSHVLLSEKPEYNFKIKLMAGIVPGVYMQYTESPIWKSGAKYPNIWRSLRFFNRYEVFGRNQIETTLIKYACHKDSPLLSVCKQIYEWLSGPDKGQLVEDEISLFTDNFPAGCSAKQIDHYLQVIYTGDFVKFDYGLEKNKEVYGQEKPPPYNLSKTNVPYVMFHHEYDILVTKQASKLLAKKLPNLIKMHVVKDFNHFDIIAKDVYERLHLPLLKELNKYR